MRRAGSKAPVEGSKKPSHGAQKPKTTMADIIHIRSRNSIALAFMPFSAGRIFPCQDYAIGVMREPAAGLDRTFIGIGSRILSNPQLQLRDHDAQ
jgi:hypothetical protein